MNLKSSFQHCTKHPAHRYALAVCSGEIVAGKLVRQSCGKYLDEIEAVEHGGLRGLQFDAKAAQGVIDFFGFLEHSKGEWARQVFVLEAWQQFIVWNVFGWKRSDGTRRYRTAYIEVARKNGKTHMGAGVGLYMLVADDEGGSEVYAGAPLALDTKVATRTGWSTMADLDVGDYVFDESGQQCKVIGTSPVFEGRECFRVVFDDGSSFVTDSEHLWTVDSVYLGESKAGLPRGTRPRFRRTLSTARIHETMRTPRGSSNYRIPAAEPLQLDEAQFAVPPYTLGVWLGDGRANRGAIVHSHEDKEIVARIESEGEHVSYHGDGSLLRYTILGLRGRLSRLGLLENKHVPSAYLRGCQAQRLELLRGLLDSDGTCTKTGEIRFTNRNESLAQGVAHLMASLGLIPKIHSVIVTDRPHWIVSVRGNVVPLFALLRKARRQVIPTQRARRRRIVDVQRVDTVPVRCVSVDSSSSLFLVGESLVPTHNTKRDQAKILWDEAKRMVSKSPFLKRKIYSSRANMSVEKTASKFEPLGADADTLDGLNVHCAIIDELHAHKSAEMYEVLETSTGARRQPLMFSITTAGSDVASFCYEQHEYAEKILSGVIPDDNFFAYIATLDEGDAWDDPDVWIKSNPNLGISVKASTIKDAVFKAKELTSNQNSVRRYRLNQWTRADTRFIDLARWDAGAGELMPAEIEEITKGRIGYGGLDLSMTTDISAFVVVFPPEEEDGVFDVVCRFWIPGEDIAGRERKGRAPYQQWVDEGWITATDGDVIDYRVILAQIIKLNEGRKILQIAHDPYNAAVTVGELGDEGFDMVEFTQSFKNFNYPTKEFEKFVLSKRLRHGMNPVLRWMVDNVSVRTGPSGNLMPIKPKNKMSPKKIDGVVSLIMALDRALRNDGVVDTGSIYEERGVLVL